MLIPWPAVVLAVYCCVFSKLCSSPSLRKGNTHVCNELWADLHSISESGVLRRTKSNYNLTMMSSPVLYINCKRYPCYRPWRPLGLREVEAPTRLRQIANRWWQGFINCRFIYFFVGYVMKLSVCGLYSVKWMNDDLSKIWKESVMTHSR
jgi:hypothetical protein